MKTIRRKQSAPPCAAINEEIERLAQGTTYIDAVTFMADRDGIEIEVLARKLNHRVLSMITMEARNMNLLKAKPTPPLFG